MIQRFFGIVRAIDGHPTCKSWLHLFRILSLYNSSKMEVNGGNVDNEEQYELLMEYKDCLLKRFKEGSAAADAVRQSMKETLLEELRQRFVDNIPDETADISDDLPPIDQDEPLPDDVITSIQNTSYVLSDYDEIEITFEDEEEPVIYGGTKNQGIYDVVGYVLHSRCRHILDCKECKNLMETEEHLLPQNFLAADYTAMRTHGGLKFPSIPMFKT